VLLTVLAVYFALQIIAKFYLSVGDADTACRIFRMTCNRRGQAVALAAVGDTEKALSLAGSNEKLRGIVLFGAQQYEGALSEFRKVRFHQGIFFSLVGLGRFEEAQKALADGGLKDDGTLALRLEAGVTQRMPALHAESNNLALASCFLKCGELPSALYYLRKDSTPVSQAVFCMLTGSQASLPLSDKASPMLKLGILSDISKGNLEIASEKASGTGYKAALRIIEALTGRWDEYLSAEDLHNIFPIENIFAPLPETKLKLDEIVQKDNSFWIQPAVTEDLLVLPVVSTYRVFERSFKISLIAAGILLLLFLAREFFRYRKKKAVRELSLLDAVQNFPHVARETSGDAPSHSWDTTDQENVQENELAILKTVMEKLSVPFSIVELNDKVRKVQIKNKAYKIYSITTQFNLYVKIIKSEMDKIDGLAEEGLIIFVMNDGSVQLFISREGEQYDLFDGKSRNQYSQNALGDIWSKEIITIKKIS
jgi:hypothetical protein